MQYPLEACCIQTLGKKSTTDSTHVDIYLNCADYKDDNISVFC